MNFKKFLSVMLCMLCTFTACAVEEEKIIGCWQDDDEGFCIYFVNDTEGFLISSAEEINYFEYEISDDNLELNFADYNMDFKNFVVDGDKLTYEYNYEVGEEEYETEGSLTKLEDGELSDKVRHDDFY